MIRPGEEGYNRSYWDPDKIRFNTITIDQAIQALTKAKEIVGGDCILLMSYDSGAGYDSIKSIYTENFDDLLVTTISCSSKEEDCEGKIDTFAEIIN